MKFIFFCQNNYAFGIIKPIRDVVMARGYEHTWFIREKLNESFPFKEDNYTNSLNELKTYPSDVIIIPGNEVPHYLSGVKTQIFHGLAGEKKTHFRIRHYFDLYLTSGPYFTERFEALSRKHKNFSVTETGWSKLDKMYADRDKYNDEKQQLLEKHNAEKIILYAPTFTPYLTSAPFIEEEILQLAENKSFLIHIKFHGLMSEELKTQYKAIADRIDNVSYITDPNITKSLLLADLMISDTSSVVYEFLLLDKPVITFKNIAIKKYWQDIEETSLIYPAVINTFAADPYREQRRFIIENYHPLTDGKSSERMVDAIEEYITKHGVPKKRKLSPYRKYRIHKRFKNTL